MELTILIDDELAQENIRTLWRNNINVTQVVNDCLANLKFDFRCDIQPITIQETATDICHSEHEAQRISVCFSE